MATSNKITWLADPYAVARDALAEYGILAQRLIPLPTTYNAVFRVDSGDTRLVLRIHRLDGSTDELDEDVNYINSELVWLQALSRDTDLGVPRPLANRAGQLVTLVATERGPMVCSLLTWLEGRFLDQGLRPIHLERVGEMTARLHDYNPRFVPPPGFSRERADSFDGPHKLYEFAPIQNDVREVLDYVGADFARYSAEAGRIATVAFTRIWADLAEFGDTPDRFGLIHADIHQWNYLFWHDEVRLLDFNNLGYAPYLYDFAVTLDNLLDRPDYPALKAALLRGYQRRRDLPPDYARPDCPSQPQHRALAADHAPRLGGAQTALARSGEGASAPKTLHQRRRYLVRGEQCLHWRKSHGCISRSRSRRRHWRVMA